MKKRGEPMSALPEPITRAKELATWQCEIEEIAAVMCEEQGWGETQANSWLTRMAGVITRARLTARAELRGMIWRAASNKQRRRNGTDEIDPDDIMDKDRWNIVLEVMRQHAGWARTAPMDELMRAFLQAQKQADAKGPKRGPTGVVA
jgi:hypothetical protein